MWTTLAELAVSEKEIRDPISRLSELLIVVEEFPGVSGSAGTYSEILAEMEDDMLSGPSSS
jgi:hypothetical protein